MSPVEKALRGVVGIGAILGLFVGLAFLSGALSCDSLRRLAGAGTGASASGSATGRWGDGTPPPPLPPRPSASPVPPVPSSSPPPPVPAQTPAAPAARPAQDAVVYIYTDDDGTPNIVQGIQNVPARYKDRAKPHE